MHMFTDSWDNWRIRFFVIIYGIFVCVLVFVCISLSFTGMICHDTVHTIVFSWLTGHYQYPENSSRTYILFLINNLNTFHNSDAIWHWHIVHCHGNVILSTIREIVLAMALLICIYDSFTTNKNAIFLRFIEIMKLIPHVLSSVLLDSRIFIMNIQLHLSVTLEKELKRFRKNDISWYIR